MSTIGTRLKEERERLGLTQVSMAEKVDSSRTSQQHYENDRRYPDAGYLAQVSALGVDVQYVITGQRSATTGERVVENDAA